MDNFADGLSLLGDIWAKAEEPIETPDENVEETTDEVVEETIEEDTPETEESSEEDNTEEELEEEIVDDSDYADFIPKEYIPKKFKDDNTELNWYRDNYKKALQSYETQEFRETILDKYSDHLLKADQNYEKLKVIHTAFEKDPELMIKLYYPEFLASKGIEVKFKDEEKYSLVDKGLQKEFGHDYKLHYNPEDITNVSSLSYKMYNKQNELLNSLEAQEKTFQEEYSKKNPSPEQLQNKIQEQKNQYFGSYTDEEFGSFIKEIETWTDYSLLDIHHMKYFDKYSEAIYQQAFEDGKKAVANGIKQAGKTVPYQETKKVEVPKDKWTFSNNLHIDPY